MYFKLSVTYLWWHPFHCQHSIEVIKFQMDDVPTLKNVFTFLCAQPVGIVAYYFVYAVRSFSCWCSLPALISLVFWNTFLNTQSPTLNVFSLTFLLKLRATICCCDTICTRVASLSYSLITTS